MKWCEQRGMMCDWQLEVMPLILYLGWTGGKNSSLVIEECFWSFSQKHSSCLHVFFFVCLFWRMEFLRMELQGSVVHLFKKLIQIWSRQVLQAAVEFSQSFVWQRAPWPLLRGSSCCGGSLQGVARCHLSSFRPWQQMLSITESLRLVCFFTQYCWNLFTVLYDLDIQNEFFNREFFPFWWTLRQWWTCLSIPKILWRL